MTAVFSGTDWLAYVLLSLYALAFGGVLMFVTLCLR